MMEQQIKNDYIEYWLEDGILMSMYAESLSKIDMEVARAMVHDRKRLSNGISRPAMVDLKRMIWVDTKARKFLAEDSSTEFISALAILVNNPTAKLLASLFIKLDKPKLPTKVFSNKGKALEWLETYKFLN